jgi:hypothetical protein
VLSELIPVTPQEFENALFFMPDDETFYLLHLNQSKVINDSKYIDITKGEGGLEEFFTEDDDSLQCKLKAAFSLVNIRVPFQGTTDFRTLILGLKKPYK